MKLKTRGIARKVQHLSVAVSLAIGAYDNQVVSVSIPTPVSDTGRTSVRCFTLQNGMSNSASVAWVLTDSSTITFYLGKGSTAGTLYLYIDVVEYYDLNVQRYCGTFSASGSPLTLTLSKQVDLTKAWLNPCVNAMWWHGGGSNYVTFGSAYLYSASQVRFEYTGTGGSPYVAYEVIYPS